MRAKNAYKFSKMPCVGKTLFSLEQLEIWPLIEKITEYRVEMSGLEMYFYLSMSTQVQFSFGEQGRPW